MVDLVAQWLKHEFWITRVFMMTRVQNPELVALFFYTPFLSLPFHNSLFSLHRFYDHLLRFLPHCFNVYCSVHTENLLSSDIGIEISNFCSQYIGLSVY